MGSGKVYPIKVFNIFRALGKLKWQGTKGRNLVSVAALVFLSLLIFKLPTSGLNNPSAYAPHSAYQTDSGLMESPRV